MSWSEVIRAMEDTDLPPEDIGAKVERFVNKWAGCILSRRYTVNERTVTAVREMWKARDIWGVVKRQAALSDHVRAKPHHYITDLLPRDMFGPVVLFQAEGKTVLLDGRRRANVWKDSDEMHPALVIRPK